MGHDVFAGHLFLFMSKQRNRCKILTWHHGGFVLYYKRLEKGRFPTLAAGPNGSVASIDAATLAMLLDGVDCKKIHRSSFWEPKDVRRDRLADPDVIKDGHERGPETAPENHDAGASTGANCAARIGVEQADGSSKRGGGTCRGTGTGVKRTQTNYVREKERARENKNEIGWAENIAKSEREATQKAHVVNGKADAERSQ
jgi:transposase